MILTYIHTPHTTMVTLLAQATAYRPADAYNFLRDWRDGAYPAGWADKPVTWVAVQDSEAYCAWAGKRLPHDWEWQYAAQGGAPPLAVSTLTDTVLCTIRLIN